MEVSQFGFLREDWSGSNKLPDRLTSYDCLAYLTVILERYPRQTVNKLRVPVSWHLSW